MARTIFGLLGVVWVLIPERVLETVEQLALENPADCTVRKSSIPAIRAEGALFALTSLIGGKAHAWLLNLIGIGGVLAIVFPKQSLDFSTFLMYERPEDVAWKDGFTTFVRCVGVLYILIAATAFRRRNRDS